MLRDPFNLSTAPTNHDGEYMAKYLSYNPGSSISCITAAA